MKVSGPSGVAGASKAKGAGKVGDGSFSKFLDGAEETHESSGVGGVSRISAVNIVNEVEADGRGKRRQLMDEGEDILNELGKIRDALLGGNISADNLRVMQGKIAHLEANCDDPALNEIIEEIKIRAAVELAKLGF